MSRPATSSNSRTPNDSTSSFPSSNSDDGADYSQSQELDSSKNPPAFPDVESDSSGSAQRPHDPVGESFRNCTTPNNKPFDFSTARGLLKSQVLLMDRELRQRREDNKDLATQSLRETDHGLGGSITLPSHAEPSRGDDDSSNVTDSLPEMTFKPRYSVLTSLDFDDTKLSPGIVNGKPPRPYQPWHSSGTGELDDPSTPDRTSYGPFDPTLLLSLGSTPSPSDELTSRLRSTRLSESKKDGEQQKEPLRRLPTRFPVVRPEPITPTSLPDFDNLLVNEIGCKAVFDGNEDETHQRLDERSKMAAFSASSGAFH